MDYKSIGKSISRVDARSKVTGKTLFPQDIYIDGMLYGKTLRSRVPKARIEVDTSKAEKLAGVVRIFTAKDVPGEKHHGVLFKDHEVFCENEVRRAGDPIAFIVAETQEIAREAIEKIEVRYEELEGVFDPVLAMSEDSPRVHENHSNICYHYSLRKGDVEEAFKECDVIAENEYKVGMVDPAFMQPEAGVAYMEDEKVVVCVSSQYPHFDRLEIAAALGIDESEVTCLNPAVGGAFGGREDITMHIHLALAAKELKRPVKAVYNRKESFLAHAKRHSVKMRYKTGATKDGKLKALSAELIGDTGAYASWAVNVMRKCGVHGTGPYEIPNVNIQSYAVYTNNPFAGAMRGFGATQPPVAYEQQMDILAEKLGMDPMEFRLKNIFVKGSFTATGQELYESVPLDRCINAIEGYFKSRGSHPDSSANNKKIGVGYAAIFYGTGYGNGFPDISVCNAELALDGKINLYLAATDCGQGADTIMQQIAAESFKSDISIINYISGNTDLTKDSGTAAASRQTYNTGNAVKMAADRLKEKLLEKAKELLGLNTTLGLDVCDGEIFLKTKKDIRLSLKELAQGIYGSESRSRELLREEATFIAQTTAMDKEDGQGCPYWPYTFGACGVEVEIDTSTGKLAILDAASAQDVGKAINPQLIEGQMDGGFAMGFGYAVFENLQVEKGRINNNSFSSYIIPTAKDMPDLKKFIVEDPEGTGPYGAKGIGEPVMIYVAPAILNAIYDAVGVRIYDLPATPEKILKALKAKNDLQN